MSIKEYLILGSLFLVSLIPSFVRSEGFTFSEPLFASQLFALLIVILFIKFLPEKLSFSTSALLISSPAFIALSSNYYSLIVFLAMVASVLPWWVATFLLIPSSFGFVEFVGSIILFSFKGDKKAMVLPFFVFLFFFKIPSSSLNFIFFSDIGGWGFASFFIVLTVIGWFSSWKNNKIKLVLITSMVFLSFLFSQFIYFLLIPLSFLAAIGFNSIKSKKWEIDIVKKFALFAIILGILFTTISFIDRVQDFPPTNDMINGAKYLEGLESGLVLSRDSNSVWIKKISGMDVISDSEIFHSYDLGFVNSKLLELNVSYIVITKDMKEGAVWERDDQEFLFLLSSKLFTKLFSNEDIEIWKYNPNI